MAKGESPGRASLMSIEIVTFVNDLGPLTKSISLDEHGALRSDSSACRMSRGCARRRAMEGIEDLGELIGVMPSNESLALGSLRAGLPDQVEVVTRRALGSAKSAITRTKDNIHYRPGAPGFVLADADTKGMSGAIARRMRDAGGFWPLLTGVMPQLAGVARAIRASTSAGLYNGITGEPIAGSNGMHGYLAVIDVADSSRFLKTLHARCWLAGLGWYVVSRSGALLERSIVDAAVGSPERLVFEGQPILAAPLAQRASARRPVVVPGDVLDTRAACPPLTVVETAQLHQIQAQARHKLAAPAAEAQAKFVDEEVTSLVARTGMPRRRAIETVRRQCEGVLSSNVVLEFDDPGLDGATVADVLADPEAYVGETLADPNEGPRYGRCKAIILRRPTGEVWCNSFAHGGIRYELRHDAVAVEAAIKAAEEADAAATLVDLLPRAAVSATEQERLVAQAKQRSGRGVRAIMREIKAARDEEGRRRAKAEHERQIAERDDPRLLMEAPDPEGEFLPVMQALNGVLGASLEAMPPARNLEGCVARPRMMASHDTHAFSDANEQEGSERDQGEGPPSWRIHALSIPETAELIERYVEFTKGDRTVHLAPGVRDPLPATGRRRAAGAGRGGEPAVRVGGRRVRPHRRPRPQTGDSLFRRQGRSRPIAAPRGVRPACGRRGDAVPARRVAGRCRRRPAGQMRAPCAGAVLHRAADPQ
jgi:hypothetical protein